MSLSAPQDLSPRRSVRPALWSALLLALVILSSGCHWFHHRAKIDIPQMDTVNEQFKYAMKQQEELGKVPAQMSKHKEQAAVTIAAFQKVVDAFPDERLQVGRSKLGIAMVRLEEGDTQRALGIFEDLIKNNADDEVGTVLAMYNAAGILDHMGRFEEAKTYYRKIFDGYTGSADPTLAKLADLSRLYYYRVRTTKP